MRCCSNSCCLALLAWAVLLPSSPQLSGAEDAAAPPAFHLPPADISDAQIAALIEQLGAPGFATREKAQLELERLGLSAFDALHAAQQHDDIEIAMRARYLVRSMDVHWTLESDPLEVKRLLRDYGEKDELERRARIDQLARLDDGEGAEPLARLARYEPHNLLSKLAALAVLKQQWTLDQTQREELAQAIEGIVGKSQRPASLWLRTFAQTLRDARSSLPQWEALTRQEEQTLARFPENSSRQIARDLLRWQADLLRSVDQQEQAVAVMERSVNLVDGTREQLLDVIGWLMERRAWELVDEVAQRYPGEFAGDPLLLYRLAESQLRRGDKASAEATAEQARALLPHNPELHVESATWLQERGLLEWATQELQLVLEQGPAGAPSQLQARYSLSEMLHDSNRELEAAQTLEVVVEAMEQDPKVMELVQQRRDPGGLRSRMHYFYSQHYSQQGDRAKQKEHLEQAIQSDPTDADALIGMYRLPDADQQWQTRSRELIQQAADHFRAEIEQWQQQLEVAQHGQTRALYAGVVATFNNQLAWLISNTEGDYAEALRCSQRSLELRPQEAGYLDTLGRCYYALGDFENAIKYQSQAVELEPHSQQIRRQLEFFQEAWAQSQQEKSVETATPDAQEGDPRQP